MNEGRIIKFPSSREPEKSNKKPIHSEEPHSIVLDLGGKNRREQESGSSEERRDVIQRKSMLIEELTRRRFRSESDVRILGIRGRELGELKTVYLENRLISSTEAEWRKNPAYWRAVVDELRARR